MRRTRPLRGSALIAIATVVLLVLTACGSRVDPATVQTLAGAGGPGVGRPAAGDPGAAPGDSVDPGAPGDAGSGGEVPGDTTPDGSGGGTGGSGTTGGSGGGGGSGSGGPPSGGGANAPGGGGQAAPCTGLRNTTGITDDVIRLGNAADVSGPVPGIFASAQEATRAYIAFFNSRSDLCGRKLELVTADSRSDNGANEAAARQFCSQVFAAVGSMSAFDAGGASSTQNCGLPDLRAVAVDPARNACRTCFSAQAVNSAIVPRSVPRYFARKYPDSVKRAATLYVNAGAAPVNARSQAEAWRRNGVNVIYEAPIDTSEFNYAPYVQELKNRGVTWVQYVGPYQFAVRLAQAMQQQSYKPDLYVLDVTGYDPRYVESGGSAVEGTRLWVPVARFERPQDNEEMALYQAWLQQVKPGATPTVFGLFAWSATRLFVEEATKLGGQLSRETLVRSLGRVRGWTANGLHSRQDVGAKVTTECERILVLRNGRWEQESPGEYMCEGTTNTGIGG